MVKVRNLEISCVDASDKHGIAHSLVSVSVKRGLSNRVSGKVPSARCVAKGAKKAKIFPS